MSNEEQKNFDLENDPVRSLLGGLKRVEAPGDFDFRVKARIASGRPAGRPSSWLPALAKLSVPLAVLLLIGGFFGGGSLIDRLRRGSVMLENGCLRNQLVDGIA